MTRTGAPTPTLATGVVTETLWRASAPIFDAIMEHPFLAGLTAGTLELDRFSYYIAQDSHYLRDYARALSTLAGRAPDAAATAMFSRHAANALLVEQSMHSGILDELGLSGGSGGSGGSALPPMSPTTLAYTSYLLATVHGRPYAEGLAAVLPCYWIYAEVGTRLLRQSSPNPLYARWIATYGGEEFAAVVGEVLALTDRVAAEVPGVVRETMQRHYLTSARYEWMFWDAAYRREGWPVG